METPPFEPPGPGVWELEATHFPRPMPKFALDGIVRGFVTGFAEGSHRYGMLLSHFEVAIVNGFWYQRPVAVGAPARASRPPSRPLLWLATRIHPHIRRRIREGAAVFAEKRWRSDLERWDGVDKPAALRAHGALLAVDPAALDDDELLEHLAACDAHIEAMLGLHHRYTMACFAPLGDLLVAVAEWTGRGTAETLDVLRGSSPISLGFATPELERLADAIRADGAAQEVLGAAPEDGAGVLEGLLALPGPPGAAARAFADVMRYRALGYDLGERLVGEMPELLGRAIRVVVHDGFSTSFASSESRYADLRSAVPPEHRPSFDDKVAEARFTNRLRDERGMYAECWAVGIARRALLEIGGRLARRGRLFDREHAVDATLDELRSMMARRSAPSPEEIAARVTWRSTKTVADCPRHLGGKPARLPDAALLPVRARRVAKATAAVVENIFREGGRDTPPTKIRGLSVNAGIYEGTARRVNRPSELAGVRRGDVLVTRSAAPFFNVVLPLLGAIVTDRGGQLCHAAIVAREYGIPGIVGTEHATALIPDGARVRVDGGAGEITVLAT